ncbi:MULTISPECIES: NAD(P)/FAD-dependent oxidoreductase [Mycolicibacterium]|jgi:3-phenylpropionate/trans-cinnamate dioxygenase ferredoxin reductase subunit|uniref:FAD-dependent oxidoreductase n=3 Tax=Mycolicibacterium TaxID=1866885 RepID=A0AAE4VE85_MYCFO|nr:MULTISPECIES: FAD-dependent oxidoreductase [Mycolicibacterium]MCV7142500.1 FAD-dependent oxidoreductase [Mycolicibacterium fortuitum]MDV7193400.1 FAD-dependent oxidoreductase [Mycolicibacterium fortuitum]MDV7206831.1 FAD-dependent oxidoreductase [Mycolicibacterium fortuitum]MDV7228349.1 FAD-dependent oxidoreductase [Mycolicibacterium fortuitum]MDV7260457.1 FAD-dependent oxidoreductase [Mycolicibacterium fortuitum]
MTPAPSVLIVGASAAGLSVADNLRRGNFAGRLTMIGEEHHLPYDRPPLSKEVLSGLWPDSKTQLRDRSTFSELDIDLRLGTVAERVDSAARIVTCSDGTQITYDDLVIATGVRPRPLPGTEGLQGVHMLRTLDDAQRLRSALDGRPRLVIVGAGFLGAEVASVARTAGADVTLISDIESPLSDVIGTELGGLLLRAHTDHGVHLKTGVKVAAVTHHDNRVTGVELADGSTLPADAVLVAIGSVPNTEWLAGSGIPIGNGVICDEFCRAQPGVWAAGDVASWHHVELDERLRLEHRTNAAEQGIAVARNILAADSPTPFTPVPYIWSDQYDLKLQIYGQTRGADAFAVIDGDLADRKFVAVYGKDGHVRGAVGAGMIRPLRAARALVAARAPWSTIEQGASV